MLSTIAIIAGLDRHTTAGMDREAPDTGQSLSAGTQGLDNGAHTRARTQRLALSPQTTTLLTAHFALLICKVNSIHTHTHTHYYRRNSVAFVHILTKQVNIPTRGRCVQMAIIQPHTGRTPYKGFLIYQHKEKEF